MYELLREALSDKKGGAVFTCFGVWHIIYMVIILGSIALGVYLLRNKSDKAKKRAINITISIAFCLYMADFFLMPFAYGEIDLEKLPFHMCTLMCIMCFWSRHNAFLGRFKNQLAILGLISNFIYVMYPAGVMWYQIHPLSYRTLQTLLFHGAMSAYGIFTLTLDNVKLSLKKCYKELIIIVMVTVWALLGNYMYNTEQRRFNWFFVLQDPFYILPTHTAPYIMPFVMIAVMMLAVLIVYAIYSLIKSRCRSKSIETNDNV